jgi:RNA polymerase sigma-70 factor (ECF subfamily)
LELVRRYAPSVFDRIQEIVRDRDLAEDLSQETFLKAFAALASHHPERKFSAWIRRIAYNTTIDYLRRQRLDTQPLSHTLETTPPPGKFRPPAAPVPGRTTSREAKRNARARAIAQAIRRLPRDQHRCVRLRFFEQRTYDEISRILGLPLGAVKTHIHRALDELQRMLDPLAASWLSDSPSDPFYSPA